jgi:hypothetical protein
MVAPQKHVGTGVAATRSVGKRCGKEKPTIIANGGRPAHPASQRSFSASSRGLNFSGPTASRIFGAISTSCS